MKLAVVLLNLILLLSLTSQASLVVDCGFLLASVGKPSDSTAIYVALVKKLALEKGAFSPAALRKFSEQSGVASPLEFLSRNISSDLHFAFERAFKSLGEVDWAKARGELEKLATDLEAKTAVRNQSQNDTASVYAAFEVDNITSREKVPWHGSFIVPRGKHPLITFLRDANTYLVDVNTQTTTLFKPIHLQNRDLFELRDGRIVLVYPVLWPGGNFFRVESVRTGEIVGEYHPSRQILSRLKFSLGNIMELSENKFGELNLVTSQEGLTIVYELHRQQEDVVETLNRESLNEKIISSGASGETFYAQIESPRREEAVVSLWGLWQGKYQPLVERVKFPFFTEQSSRLVLEDGRTIFFSDSASDFYFLYSDETNVRRIKLNQNSSQRVSSVKPIEWPTGQVSAVFEQVAIGGDELSLVSQDGIVKKVKLPPGRIMSQKAIDLGNGKRILALRARDMENEVCILFVDFDRNVVTKIGFPAKKGVNIEEIYEVEGRIFGVLVGEDRITHIVQLYGTVPVREAKQ